MSEIHRLTMPKWGLSMKEGKLVSWLVEEGAQIRPGMEIMEVETDKIANAVEAGVSGILRRKVAQEDDVVPVAGLLGIVADAEVPDAEVDAAIEAYQASFVAGADDEGEAGPTPEWLQVGTRSIRFLRQGGGGTPVVLIHGFGGDLNNWLFNHEVLASTRTVYALDLPGHGESAKDVGEGTPAEFARVLQGFMDALGLDKAHLVGHSMGGCVALEFALADPARAASLALIAGAGLGAEINREYIDGFVRSASRREIKPFLEMLFADPALVTRQLIDDMLKFKRIDGVQACLRKVADSLLEGGRQRLVLRERLADLGLPVLVLWGEADRIIPASHARDLPGSVRAETIPGKGHMVQMEAADEINRLLGAFLD